MRPDSLRRNAEILAEDEDPVPIRVSLDGQREWRVGRNGDFCRFEAVVIDLEITVYSFRQFSEPRVAG